MILQITFLVWQQNRLINIMRAREKCTVLRVTCNVVVKWRYLMIISRNINTYLIEFKGYSIKNHIVVPCISGPELLFSCHSRFKNSTPFCIKKLDIKHRKIKSIIHFQGNLGIILYSGKMDIHFLICWRFHINVLLNYKGYKYRFLFVLFPTTCLISASGFITISYYV